MEKIRFNGASFHLSIHRDDLKTRLKIMEMGERDDDSDDDQEPEWEFWVAYPENREQFEFLMTLVGLE